MLDTEEEVGVLGSLYRTLYLSNSETAFHHLKLSEEHYLNAKWDDSISNSRKFLECTLQEVAAVHSLRINKSPISEAIFTRPVRVRDYLAREGLLEKKEKDIVDYLKSISGINSARVILKPFWVKRIPSDSTRAVITIDYE